MSREVHLVRYPAGRVTADDFAVVEADVSAPGPGEVRVVVACLSMDPIVRLRMTATPAMAPAMPLGRAVAGRGVGRVVESRDPAVPVGSAVYGELGWREDAILAGAAVEIVAGDVALHHHLNALGPTGLAAWFAVDSVSPAAGETIVIAPAAGAVGSLAAQLAMQTGARVVGVGVGAVQLEFLRDLGVEAAAVGDLAGALAGGVDAFIDGVGCDLHDAVVRHLNPRARVLLLGFVAGYGDAERPRYGDMAQILMRRARVEGFLLADHMVCAAEARAALEARLRDGSLRPFETIWDGLEAAPHAFAALFGDAPPGKQLVRVKGNI